MLILNYDDEYFSSHMTRVICLLFNIFKNYAFNSAVPHLQSLYSVGYINLIIVVKKENKINILHDKYPDKTVLFCISS